MKRVTAVLAAALFAASAQGAQAQEIQVSTRLVPGGVVLDAGSGPKTYLCVKDRMTAKLVSGGKTLTFAGKYLSVIFNDNGVSFNSSDRELPRLASNEVRLSCKAGVVTARAGADILLEDPEDQEK